MLGEERKNNNTRVGLVEGRLTKLEESIASITSNVEIIQTQMTQVKKRAEEEEAQAASRVAEINKKWVAKKPVEEASTLGTKIEEQKQPSGPLDTSQRAAGLKAAPSQLVRHNGIVLPFQPKKKFRLEEQFKHFLNMFCKLHVNLPLVEALQEIPSYAKLLRDVLHKQKLKPADLKLPLHCSEIIQKQRTVKQRDPGQFIIRCSIGDGKVDKALCDLGASVNLMPLEYYEKLNIGPLKPTTISLRMADSSATKAVGLIEDVLVKVDDFIFPADFFVLDMKADKNVPLILGRNFLATCKALIDVGKGEITISGNGGRSTYYIESAMNKDEEARMAKKEECKRVMMCDVSKPFNPSKGEDPSNPAVFIVYPTSDCAKTKKKKANYLRTPLQKRKVRKEKVVH